MAATWLAQEPPPEMPRTRLETHCAPARCRASLLLRFSKCPVRWRLGNVDRAVIVGHRCALRRLKGPRRRSRAGRGERLALRGAFGWRFSSGPRQRTDETGQLHHEANPLRSPRCRPGGLRRRDRGGLPQADRGAQGCAFARQQRASARARCPRHTLGHVPADQLRRIPGPSCCAPRRLQRRRRRRSSLPNRGCASTGGRSRLLQCC